MNIDGGISTMSRLWSVHISLDVCFRSQEGEEEDMELEGAYTNYRASHNREIPFDYYHYALSLIRTESITLPSWACGIFKGRLRRDLLFEENTTLYFHPIRTVTFCFEKKKYGRTGQLGPADEPVWLSLSLRRGVFRQWSRTRRNFAATPAKLVVSRQGGVYGWPGAISIIAGIERLMLHT